MRLLRGLFGAVVLTMMTGCSHLPAEHAASAELAISQSWSGDYPVAELRRLPGGQQQSPAGYLGNSAAFASTWAAFRPGESPPAVDFDKQVVVFHRNVNFYNRTRIFKVTLRDGVAEILAIETLSALPIADRVAMAMAVIPRAGVKFVQAGAVRIPVRMDERNRQDQE